MTDAPDVQAAREAYRDACQRYCEESGDRNVEWLAKVVQQGRADLNAALAAQQARQEDEEAVEAICSPSDVNVICADPSSPKALSVHIHSGRITEVGAGVLLRSLKAAGWSLTRSPPPKATEAGQSPQTQQEPVQAATQMMVREMVEAVRQSAEDAKVGAQVRSMLDEEGYLRGLPRELRDLRAASYGTGGYCLYSDRSSETVALKMRLEAAQALAKLTAKQEPVQGLSCHECGQALR
jgi:hypothetical protein